MKISDGMHIETFTLYIYIYIYIYILYTIYISILISKLYYDDKLKFNI